MIRSSNKIAGLGGGYRSKNHSLASTIVLGLAHRNVGRVAQAKVVEVVFRVKH